ncbi:hypothetical protein ILYODFUR_012823 [Ilyodon furcidens]|uniref:Uncharacterized protein n=1 Tax=Ilyodon furcidens TaxID=33524 RepID=A0ABV0TWZ5_9TELE
MQAELLEGESGGWFSGLIGVGLRAWTQDATGVGLVPARLRSDANLSSELQEFVSLKRFYSRLLKSGHLSHTSAKHPYSRCDCKCPGFCSIFATSAHMSA